MSWSILYVELSSLLIAQEDKIDVIKEVKIIDNIQYGGHNRVQNLGTNTKLIYYKEQFWTNKRHRTKLQKKGKKIPHTGFPLGFPLGKSL